MATRGTIAVVHGDGTVSQIYMHWDSQIEHSGRLLHQFYNTLAKVEELVAGGSISYLGDHICPTGKHSFLKPEKGCTVYFNRDRGDEKITVNKYDSIDLYYSHNSICDYHYLFANNQWLVKGQKTKKEYVPLADFFLEVA